MDLDLSYSDGSYKTYKSINFILDDSSKLKKMNKPYKTYKNQSRNQMNGDAVCTNPVNNPHRGPRVPRGRHSGGGGGGCWSIPPESTTTILNEIMTALTQPNIVIVGIYGTISANKENAVEIVRRRVERDGLFNVVVKTSVMKKPDLKRIQGELGNALGLQLHEKTLEERATCLCERIKMEDKILIILDDLQAEINLAKIGIPFGNDHKGCKILLVAQNNEVLSDKMKTQKEIYVDEPTRNR